MTPVYDLHLHSCLSPCAENEMTPASIAGFAKLCGLQLIALTDHNSAENLPAMAAACRAYGVALLPGMEVNTAEEIHLLCYFATVEAALTFSRALYDTLPPVENNEAVFGSQLVVDADDTVLRRVPKLLLSACGWSLEETAARCRALGGVPVPAHVDRDSYSVLSVLGLLPPQPAFCAVELHDTAQLPALLQAGRLPGGLEVLCSSDAHRLADVTERPFRLCETSVLQPLLHAVY